MSLYLKTIFAAAAVAVAATACAGGGSSAPAESVVPSSTAPAAGSRATAGALVPVQPVEIYAGTIQDLQPPCGAPSNSCTGRLSMKGTFGGPAIAGTWEQIFSNPTAVDKGAFTGTLTSSDHFTAQFASPTDAPCTLTVSGKINASVIVATYVYNTTAACPVVDNGSITLHRTL